MNYFKQARRMYEGDQFFIYLDLMVDIASWAREALMEKRERVIYVIA
jgi:hypothetical protein